MVAMTPLFTVQIIGLMYDRRMKATKAEEQEEMGAIAESVEEEEFVGWGAAAPRAVASGDGAEGAEDENVQDDYVQDDYAQEANMDFVASPEWVEAVHTEERHEEVTMDNNYIDFDECEMK
jgi:hypothetical protein